MSTFLVDRDQCAEFLQALDTLTESVNSLQALCGERQTAELLEHFLETMRGSSTEALH
jgi:adenylosuccinate lyase